MMPSYERLPINVTLMVEVDGQRLEFTETTTAAGSRHALRGDILEENIRRSVDSSIASAHRKAVEFVDKAWASADATGLQHNLSTAIRKAYREGFGVPEGVYVSSMIFDEAATAALRVLRDEGRSNPTADGDHE